MLKINSSNSDIIFKNVSENNFIGRTYDEFYEVLRDKHCIIYSSNSHMNYLYILYQLKLISPSQLGNVEQFEVTNGSDESYMYNMSDVHIDIDLQLLGVNEYTLFNNCLNKIKQTICSIGKDIVVVCNHFHNIQPGLLDIIYSFLLVPHIKFVFLTTELTFINPDIIQSSKIKKLKPSLMKRQIIPEIDKTKYKERINNICDLIVSKVSVDIYQLRCLLYELLIHNYNIYNCNQYLIEKLIEVGYINETNIEIVLKKYVSIMEKYNNNYRIIYHLEKFIFMLKNI